MPPPPYSKKKMAAAAAHREAGVAAFEEEHYGEAIEHFRRALEELDVPHSWLEVQLRVRIRTNDLVDSCREAILKAFANLGEWENAYYTGVTIIDFAYMCVPAPSYSADAHVVYGVACVKMKKIDRARAQQRKVYEMGGAENGGILDRAILEWDLGIR
jgi:hypothetical protein